MKMEELLKKCPECGCQDKTVQRKILDEHRAHAKTKAIVCEKCGYEFESGDKDEKCEE